MRRLESLATSFLRRCLFGAFFEKADRVILRLTISSLSANSKPVQERNSCRDCKNDQFGTSHTADQHEGKRNSQAREDNSAGQEEALPPRHFLAQRRQRGACNSISEKTRQGRERGVPTERAHQARAQSRTAKATIDV
jgi:hypothetical protein